MTDLPPLPEPASPEAYRKFSAIQMREYAKKAVEACLSADIINNASINASDGPATVVQKLRSTAHARLIL